VANKDLKTTADAWGDVVADWSPDSKVGEMTQGFLELFDIDPDLKRKTPITCAIDEVTSLGDVGLLSRPAVTSEKAENLEGKRKKIYAFCSNIHLEASGLVDVPFANKASDVVQAAYGLKPSKVKLTKKNALGISYSVSLFNIMNTVITDPKLKDDFAKKVDKLNTDKPSEELQQAIDYSRYAQTMMGMLFDLMDKDPDGYSVWGQALIYSQEDYPEIFGYGPWGNIPDNACGAIAIHNANNILGLSTNYAYLYYLLNKSWPLITTGGGYFGTKTSIISEYYKWMGCNVKSYTNMSKVSTKHEAYVIFYPWKGDKLLDFGAHYVSAKYENGKFVVYNNSGKVEKYDTLDDFRKQHSTVIGMQVWGIDKKK